MSANFTDSIKRIKNRTTWAFYSSSHSIFTFVVCITRSFSKLVISIRFTVAWWEHTVRIKLVGYSKKMYTLAIVRKCLNSPFIVCWTISLFDRSVISAKNVPRRKSFKWMLNDPIPLFLATWSQVFTVPTFAQQAKVYSLNEKQNRNIHKIFHKESNI